VNSEVLLFKLFLDSHYKMPSNQNIVFPEVAGAVNIFSMTCNDEWGWSIMQLGKSSEHWSQPCIWAVISLASSFSEFFFLRLVEVYNTCITTKFSGKQKVFDWATIFSFSPLLRASEHWGNDSIYSHYSQQRMVWSLCLCWILTGGWHLNVTRHADHWH